MISSRTPNVRCVNKKEMTYEAQYKEAEVTLRVYANNPVAIGEHPQHIEEMDKLVCAMNAQDKLDIVKKVYPDKEFLAE